MIVIIVHAIKEIRKINIERETFNVHKRDIAHL